MYIIRGNFFGYFIASSYSCPFFLAMLLIQVPTPSFVAVNMLLVGDTYLLTDPFWSPTLTLLVVVAFSMWYIFWRCVGNAISAKLFAVWTVGRVDVPFIKFPADASPCTQFAAIYWQITAR